MSVEQCQLMGSGSISASDCTFSLKFFLLQSWSPVLLNFRTFLRSWTPGKPQECDCKTWYKENTGHLFSHVRQILPVECSSSLSLSSGQVSQPSQEGCVCVCAYTLP